MCTIGSVYEGNTVLLGTRLRVIKGDGSERAHPRPDPSELKQHASRDSPASNMSPLRSPLQISAVSNPPQSSPTGPTPSKTHPTQLAGLGLRPASPFRPNYSPGWKFYPSKSMCLLLQDASQSGVVFTTCVCVCVCVCVPSAP